MKKRLLSLFVAMAMVLGMMPSISLTARAAEGDVAEVNGTGYATIDAAIEAAQATEGSTLKLLADVPGGIIINSGTFTLDLGGYTINSTTTAVKVTSGGEVTIEGEGAISGDEYGVYVNGGGNVTIEDGNVEGGYSGVYVGGTESAATILGDTNISSVANGVWVDGGTVNISGGSVSGAGAGVGVYVVKGEANISGGTVIGGDFFDISIYAEGGQINVTGGSFNSDPYLYVDTDTYSVTQTGDMWVVSAAGGTEPAPPAVDYAAEVNGTGYATIDAALEAAAASEGSTLKLLADVPGGMTINSGTFTLDLNGHTIGGTYAVYVKGGEITITGGTISGTCCVFVEGGSCTIVDGTINGSHYSVVVVGGSCEIIGGAFNGEAAANTYAALSIRGGTFSHAPAADYIAEGFGATQNSEGKWVVAEGAGVSFYFLWIGGERVTSDNLSGEGWSYAPDTNTLTLNNYTYEGTGHMNAAIYYGSTDGLHLVLEGINTITHTGGGSESRGIHAEGDLIVSGSGTLTATGSQADFSSDGVVTHNLTVSSGTLTGIGGASEEYSDGIFVHGDLMITGGEVIGIGGQANENSYGIYVFNNAAISGGTVTATGGADCGDYSLGMYANTAVISGGTVTVTGGSSTAHSYGLYGADLTISGGELIAEGGTEAIYAENDVTVADTHGVYDESNAIIENPDYTALTYVRIKEKPVLSYAAKVGEQGFESLEDALASDLSTDNTITLLKTVDLGEGTLEIEKKVILDLNGNNIKSTGSTIEVLSGGDLTIRGNGTVSGGFCGVFVDDGNVTIEGGTVAGVSNGICVVDGELTITGGTVSDGYSGVMVYDGDITITGGSVSGKQYGVYVTGELSISDNANISGNYGVQVEDGKCVISGGSVSGTSRGISVIGGEANISGGTVSGDYGVYAEGGTVNIESGTVSGTNGVWIEGDGSCTISGGTIIGSTYSVAVAAGSCIITGGTFTGVPVANAKDMISITGGKFSHDPTAYVAEGYAATKQGDMWVVAEGAVVIPYPLWIGGVRATSNNLSGEGWSYDPDTRTLTLNNYTYTGTGYWDAAICYQSNEELYLVLEGSSTVTYPGGTSEDSYVLLTYGDLSISGSGTLTAIGGAAGYSYGIRAEGNFTMSGGEIIASGGQAESNSYGIYVNGVFTMKDGSITATGGAESRTYSIGMYAIEEAIISGGTITATGEESRNSVGFMTKGTMTMTDGTLTALGGTAVKSSIGITADGGAAVSGGTITATGGASTDTSTGLSAKNLLTISGGEVTAAGGTALLGASTGLIANEGLMVSDGTLTSTGGTSADRISFGVYVWGPVAVSGGQVTAIGGQAAEQSIGMQMSSGDLTINGGSLTVIADQATEGNSCGILIADGKAIVADGELIATADQAANNSIGLDVWNSLEISGGRVEVAAENLGVYVEAGSLAISGGELIAEGGTEAIYAENGVTVADTHGVYDKDGNVIENPDYTALTYVKISRNHTEPTDPPAGEDEPVTPPVIDDDDDYEPTYRPTIEETEGGETTVNKKYPEQGEKVTITTEPDKGYEVEEVIVRDRKGKEIEVTDNGDGTYTFRQPAGRVTIEVIYAEMVCDGGSGCAAEGFADLDPALWYHEAVDYILEKGLMQGTGPDTFAPNGTTTRAQLATILWRLEGMPVVNYLMQFDDVSQNQWYSEAVRWAAAEGIVGGYGKSFGPDDAITREQFATILHRYAQYKGMDVSVGEETNILSYMDAFDISEWAIPAIQWACGSGLMEGDGAYLMPMDSTTRAQSAALLMRFMENN